MRVPPVPVPDAAALAEVPEPVTCCGSCGFLGVRMPGLADGGVPGHDLARVACPRCGHVGLPLSFRTRGEYADFLAQVER